jgi:hypothetical protein
MVLAQQNDGAQESGWYMYFGDHPLRRKWGLHLEGQWRREPIIANNEQLLLRPGVNYSPSKTFLATFAYTYVRDYPPFGSTEVAGVEPRHSINEEIQWHRHLPGFLLENSVRLQQTFAGDLPYGQITKDWKFLQRVHYRMGVDIPTHEGRSLLPNYYAVHDEVIFGFGSHSGHQALKQNRAYGALGWNLRTDVQLELGYLRQYRPVPNGIIGEENNALQLTIKSSAPLSHIIHRAR